MSFRILQIDHLVLRVRDVEAMLAFYTGALGCTLERVQAPLGLYQVRAGASLIDLITIDGELGRAGGAAPGTQGRNLDHLCLRIDPFDITALRDHFRTHGIELPAPALRFGAEGQGPSVYLNDPEGNTIELKGPPGALPVAPG